MRTNHIPVETPWGPSQTHCDIAPGLTFYSTAGHGGLFLSPDRWADLTTAFRFKSFAGPQWLEEDCDFGFAVIRWPDLFEPICVHSCVRSISRVPSGIHYPGWTDNGAGARAWLASPAGEAARRIAAEFSATVDGQWERGSMCGDRDGWLVHFHRGAESREGLFPDYPAKFYYTDAELAPAFAAAASYWARKAAERIAAEQRREEERAQARRRQAEAEAIYDLDASGQCYSDAVPGF
jgi:hypothetical protein